MASVSELQEASIGLGDKAFGLAREAIGTLLGNDKLAEEGRAQQDKGSERLNAIKHEVKADAYRAKANASEEVERAHQDSPGARKEGNGLVERLKGQAKETVGAISNDDKLKREGQAQQERGEAKTDAMKEEAKAEAARARSRAADARQQVAERS